MGWNSVAMTNNTRHRLTSTKSEKARTTMWQMAQVWWWQCGKVVGQQYNYTRTVLVTAENRKLKIGDRHPSWLLCSAGWFLADGSGKKSWFLQKGPILCPTTSMTNERAKTFSRTAATAWNLATQKISAVNILSDRPSYTTYSVIKKDGLNFVRLYFLNCTRNINDLHNIWNSKS